MEYIKIVVELHNNHTTSCFSILKTNKRYELQVISESLGFRYQTFEENKSKAQEQH